MRDFFLRLLGFDPSNIPPDATLEFVWTNADALASWRVFAYVALLLLLAWGVFHMYRREMDTCPRPARLFLGVVRCLVLLVLAAVFIGPALQISEHRKRHSISLLLIDDSLSMTTKDQYLDDEAADHVASFLGKTRDQVRADRPDRAMLVNQILTSDGGKLVREMARKGNVKVVFFSSEARRPLDFPYLKTPEQLAAEAAAAGADVNKIQKASVFDYLFFENPLPMMVVFLLGAAVSFGLAVQKRSIAGVIGGLVLVALAPAVYISAANVETAAEKQARQATQEPVKPTEPAPPSDQEKFETLLAGLKLEPRGQFTDIHNAIKEALAASPGVRCGGIVLVTDGQPTGGGDSPLIAADLAGEKDVPIFIVGVGDPSKKRNLKINSARANETVRRNNPFQIEAEIEAEGLPGTTARVELVARAVPGAGADAVIEARDVTLPDSQGSEDAVGSAIERLSFEFNPKIAGDHEFIVRVASLGRESDDDDNTSRPVRVKVRSDKARVLLISGGPTWEYRPLQALLTRADDINLSVWLQSLDLNMQQEGNTKITHLPANARELFEYDAVIMLDPDPREFNESWIAMLQDFLAEQGGGLLYMPGPKYATQFLSYSRIDKVRDLLPVKFGDMGMLDVKTLTSTHVREWPLSLVPAEMDSPLLRFDTTNAQFNQAVWNAMPGIFWSFPAIGAKPASRVLIEHSDPALRAGREKRPLLATGLYGPGRVVYMGFNGTWRWRRLGNDSEYYEKFWIQAVNFLIAGKDQRGSNRGFIDLSKDTYHRGDRVVIEAKLKDASFQPLDVPVVEATLKTAVGLIPVRLEKAGGETPGLYKAEIVATDLGQNVITIAPTPGVDGKPAQPIIKAFDVGLPRVEFENTRLNRPLLTEVADRSKGKYFDIEDWSKAIAEVKDAGENPVVPRKPYELWSTDRLLLLLVFLLTVEWAVRKRYKLL